jgi:hypothetical protein
MLSVLAQDGIPTGSSVSLIEWAFASSVGELRFQGVCFRGCEGSFGHQYLRFENKIRALGPELDCRWLRESGKLDTTALQVETVAAMEIANPPTAVLKEHFGMDPTDVIIVDANFTLSVASNAETAIEGKASPTPKIAPEVYFERRR